VHMEMRQWLCCMCIVFLGLGELNYVCCLELANFIFFCFGLMSVLLRKNLPHDCDAEWRFRADSVEVSGEIPHLNFLGVLHVS
jgi:hypothetical protein